MRNGFNFLNNYYDIAKTLSAKNRLIFYDLIMELNFSCFKTETELEQFCSKIESELKQNQKVLVAFLGVKFSLLKSLKGYIAREKGNQKQADLPKVVPEVVPNKIERIKNKEEIINNKKENNFILNNNSSFKNPDLMFDKKVDEVFSLYEKLCPNLASLVFERRNIERRQEVKDFLWLVQSNMDYVKGLFMRANEQRTFYDNPINFKALIKNHESIYQGLGKAKAPPKDTGETMKENFAKWRKEAEEREALNGD